MQNNIISKPNISNYQTNNFTNDVIETKECKYVYTFEGSTYVLEFLSQECSISVNGNAPIILPRKVALTIASRISSEIGISNYPVYRDSDNTGGLKPPYVPTAVHL